MGINCNHPTCQTECRREVKQKKVAKINTVSQKRKAEDLIYKMLRKPFLAQYKQCHIKAPGCTKLSTVVHHTRGRIIYYLTVSTWMASCAHCNIYIENNDAWAREKGFFKSKFQPL